MGKVKRTSPIVPTAAAPALPPTISKRQQKMQNKQQRREAQQSDQAPPPPQKTAATAALTEPQPSRHTMEQLLEADARCWDPDVEAAISSNAKSNGDEPLAREFARGAALRRLRLFFTEAVRKLQLSSPCVGAFERWHFGWLLAPSAAAARDPLLPADCAQPDADAALRDELVDAGCTDTEAADATVSALRASADKEASLLAAEATTKPSPCVDGEIELSVAPDNSAAGGGKVWHVIVQQAGGGVASAPLKVSDEWLDKLRAMHARTRAEGAPCERTFRVDLARLLLRYKAIGGSGFQAAIGGGTFAVLRSYFECAVECFASPLNARSAPFCSAFADVDAPFGSLGSFLRLRPSEGAFEANPPFVPLMILQMTKHMERLLTKAEAAGKPLLFAVVVGVSAALKRHAAWAEMQRLAAGAFGRAQWLLPLHAHGYTEGHAHICRGGSREARRMSSCDTAIFIWASSAAAAKWPVSAEVEAALRAAMRAMVPRQLKRATKANKSAHAAKKLKKKRAAGRRAG